MTPNLWQYLVLLGGFATVAVAFGVAIESGRREALRFVALANAGVALVALSVCATILASIEDPPTVATWLAAGGFFLYVAAAAGAHWAALGRLRIHHAPRGRTREHPS